MQAVSRPARAPDAPRLADSGILVTSLKSDISNTVGATREWPVRMLSRAQAAADAERRVRVY
jgi:hypothetical protein